MPRRYFFHAPDGRIYGPAPVEALRRWRGEGRLHAESRLRAEGGDDLFLTYDEVGRREASLPPEPKPPMEPSSPVAIEKEEAEAPPAAAALPPAPLPPPQPLASLVSDAARVARRSWAALWPALLLIQVPTIVLSFLERSYFHIALDPKTGMATLDHAGILFLAVLGLAGWTFLGHAFLAFALHDPWAGRPASPGRAWSLFAPRIGGLLWTFLLAAGILVAWAGVTLLLFGTVIGLHGFLRAIVLVTAALSTVPTCLLALRCLILPQTAALEGRRGLGALRRAIELVRLNSRNSLFSDGDLRLFALLFLSAVVFPALFLLAVFVVAALPLPERLLSALVALASVFGAAAMCLFFSSAFLHFFEDLRRRLREAGIDPS